MNRFSKIYLYLICGVLLAWIGPWCYSFLTPQNSTPMLSLYSSTINDFLTIDHLDNKSNPVWVDSKKKEYQREEADVLLPFFFLRQLSAYDRFPDSVAGKPITLHEANMGNFTFFLTPNTINANGVNLYPLMESQSKRVELAMPSDVFRITDTSIEFIDMEDNIVNAEKSEKYSRIMANKGFSFPAKIIAGNPSIRKEYDEGYLLIDSDNKLFHLKQVVGRPYVRAIDSPEGITFKHAFITEFHSHKTLGFLCDMDNKPYVLNADYSISPMDIPYFNPEEENLTIYGNVFDWSVTIKGQNSYRYYALSADDYSLIKCYSKPVRNSSFGLHFTSALDKYAYPRF